MGMRIKGGAARQLQAIFEAGAIGSSSDAELLDRFRRREAASEAAFEAIVDRHARMVLRVCRDVLGDSHDAQDAAQATFFVLARKAGSIRNPDALISWLQGTAQRVARRALREAIRRRRLERRSLVISGTKPTEPETPRNWSELHEELAKLPDRYREPIILCDLNGLSHAQAAVRLGCPPRTLETRLYRGRERLKDKLIRRGVAPSMALAGLNWVTRSEATVSPGWVAKTSIAAVQITKVGGWEAAGEGSAVSVSLARSTLTELIMAKLRVVVVAGMTLGIAAGGAWSILKAQDPAEPKAKAAATKSAIKQESIPELKDAFETAYSLADGENVKLLAGEAIEARNAHFKGKGQQIGMGSDPGEFGGHFTVVFRWKDQARRWTTSMSAIGNGLELRTLLSQVLGVRGQEIEGDEIFLGTPLPVDLLIRDEIPATRLASDFEAILRRDFKMPIRLNPREETREVVIAKGKYQYKPIGKRSVPLDPIFAQSKNDWLVIYADGDGGETNNTRSRKVIGSDLPNLFSELGLYLGVRVIDEVENQRGPYLDWQITDYNLIRKIEDPERRELILKHLSEQTGLTFQREKRIVRVLHVDRDP
jgi:RNA polymerase sigma factor (sigma-70 family)